MERRSLRGLAGADEFGYATGRLPWLRLFLGAISASRTELAGFVTALSMIFLAASAYVGLALVRWNAFETNAFDLGFFDQIIFNTSRGRIFETSFVSYNFAGQHLEPVLLLFVPAYWFGAGPLTLTVTQAVVAAAAALPLYLFARRERLPVVLAVAAVAAYLLNPYLLRALAFDFHPEVMVALPAFTAAWAISTGRWRFAMVCSLSVLLFKEDAVFVAVALAGFMYLRGQRRRAVVTASVAVTYAALAVLVVMPLARGGAQSDLVERYGYLVEGGGIGSLVASLPLIPFRAARVLAAPEQAWTTALFLVTTATVAIARPRLLVVLLPGLVLALLSNHPQQRALDLHYAAEMVPVAFIAAVVVCRDLSPKIDARILAAGVAAPAMFALMLSNPFLSGHGTPPSAEHVSAVQAALRLIPDSPKVSVSAQSGLVPRVSQRNDVWEFPRRSRTADWVLLDQYGFRSSQSLDSGFGRAMVEVRETATLVYAADGVELYRRAP
ncbi:MAG: DUF2079 domain-containing protein [bacterium]